MILVEVSQVSGFQGGGPPGLSGPPGGGPPCPPGPPGCGSSGPPGDLESQGPPGQVIHVAKWFCPRPKHCRHE